MRELNSLEVLDAFVDICRKYGLKLMFDMHNLAVGGMTHEWPLWYDDDISEAEYVEALTWIVNRFKHDDTVIAIDLINEPRGIPGKDAVFATWDGSDDASNWRAASMRAARAVLAVHPDILIVVEGVESYPKSTKKGVSYASNDGSKYHITWWGANLRGVRNHPVDLGQYQDKLVYSIHDYGPSVFGQKWFYEGFTFDSLMNDYWKDTWLFIHDEAIAPVWVGEWGGHMTGSTLTWMTHLRTLIADRRLNHTFWCLNANSADTGGLVLGDFTTWDEEKYQFVEPVLWKVDGKFQGLDAEIPLGG